MHANDFTDIMLFIFSKLVFLRWRFFRIFKMVAAARIKAHQHAKYRQNRLIGCEDLKIFFRFFQEGGCHRLVFSNFIGWQCLEGQDASLYKIS